MTPREREHARAEAIEEAKAKVRGQHALALRTDYVLDLLDSVLAEHEGPPA